MTLKLGMQHQVLKCYQVCSNDDPTLTLTYFTARSNLVPYAFVFSYVPFGFQGRIWDLIVSVPDHCLSFY